MVLYSGIQDPTNSLQSFCHNVRSAFLDEGLLKLNLGEKLIPLPLQVPVVATRRLTRDPIMDEQQKWPLRPRIDATDLHRKYKDSVLMKDVQLQEIHISEIGLKKVLYENIVVPGYRNIATFSLPGFDADGTEPLQTELEARIPVRTPD